MPKTLKVCLAILSIASIHPLYWQSYLLHQIGTLLLMAIMSYLSFKRTISATAVLAMTVFLLLHIVGAVWSYSYVPYDDWSMALFNISLSQIFDFERNMYDRVVHFGYGLLCYPLIYELTKRYFYQNTHSQLIIIALLINMSSILLYELRHWAVARRCRKL